MIRAPRSFLQLFAAIPAATLLVPGPSAGAKEDFSFFERHIRPALVEHCYECHSQEAEKLKGGLRLDFKRGWEQGGDSGPAIVPGDPAASRLLEAIRYKNPDLEMPPKRKLPAALVEKFEQWIASGAPDPRTEPGLNIASEQPRTIDLEEGRRFWSFRPITNPEPPEVRKTSWPQDPIDRFILAGIEEAGLTPAPDAGPATLLRRLHFDLTGLPPSIDDIASFKKDFRRDPRAAIVATVDALLADPAFGERWGRHWLDIVRYSDSTGGGRAIPLPDAWRFRDYVIAAFNEDRPLDQVIREHIAGDLLPFANRDEQIRNLTGTGFLLLGPHNYENQDKELLDLEIVDEQLDTIGRAFLGMSLGCARCHDHKFDPIPTRDYYAMAGIFTSTRSVEHSNVSKWYRRSLPATPGEQAALETSKKEIAALERALRTVKKNLSGKKDPSGATPASELPGIVVDNKAAELAGHWLESTSLRPWVGAGYLHDENQKKGEKSATFRPDVPKTGRYEVRLSWSHSSNRASRVPVTIRHGVDESTVFVNQRLRPNHDGLFHSLGTFRFEKGSEGFVRIGTADTDNFVIVDAVQFLPEGGDPEPRERAARRAPAKNDQQAKLAAEKSRLEKALKEAEARAPKEDTVMAVAEAEKPADLHVRVRGMPRTLGEEVPRGFLQVASDPGDPSITITTGSGRKELAEWITSPGHPLTARVLANRIWGHLLGSGIVRTPDNLGLSGELPSHPELLDHLARRLINGDWSSKKLIRAIVLSRTYQLASQPGPQSAGIDPDNRLLSHAHRRALDAEALRDSILHLGGRLDRTAGGGPSLPPGFKSEFGYKFTTLRRSVYVPVFRNNLYELFATFDFANPNFTVGRRPDSTIPTQSLFLANSPFIHENANAAALEVLKLEAADDRERLRLAFLRTLGRPPAPDEMSAALAFLKDSRNPENADNSGAWAALHRSLFSSLDFRYLP